MKVMCLILESPVSASTAAGRQVTIWTRSGECPHATRISRTAVTKWCEDQATFSDGFTTMALPVKREAMMGDRML